MGVVLVAVTVKVGHVALLGVPDALLVLLEDSLEVRHIFSDEFRQRPLLLCFTDTTEHGRAEQ